MQTSNSLTWTLTFFLLALVCGVFGLTNNVASTSYASIGFVLFFLLFLISLAVGFLGEAPGKMLDQER